MPPIPPTPPCTETETVQDMLDAYALEQQVLRGKLWKYVCTGGNTDELSIEDQEDSNLRLYITWLNEAFRGGEIWDWDK